VPVEWLLLNFFSYLRKEMIIFSETEKIETWNKIIPTNICGVQMHKYINPTMVVKVLGKTYRIKMEVSG
jgi:hypothetical protein